MVETRTKFAIRLGKNINRWRKALGLTQDQLAVRLGVEPETISRFERGATLPSLPTLSSLAQILGTTMGQLLEEEPPRSFSNAEKVASWLEPLTNNEQKFVMDMMSRLSAYFSGLSKKKK
jgi:transcriptional regulator with XRE-family HTH domain